MAVRQVPRPLSFSAERGLARETSHDYAQAQSQDSTLASIIWSSSVHLIP